MVLILGQLVYGGLLRLPALFAYPEIEIKPDFVGPASSLNLLSPISVRDDLICSVRPSLQPSPIAGTPVDKDRPTVASFGGDSLQGISPILEDERLKMMKMGDQRRMTPQLMSPAAGA